MLVSRMCHFPVAVFSEFWITGIEFNSAAIRATRSGFRSGLRSLIRRTPIARNNWAFLRGVWCRKNDFSLGCRPAAVGLLCLACPTLEARNLPQTPAVPQRQECDARQTSRRRPGYPGLENTVGQTQSNKILIKIIETLKATHKVWNRYTYIYVVLSLKCHFNILIEIYFYSLYYNNYYKKNYNNNNNNSFDIKHTKQLKDLLNKIKIEHEDSFPGFFIINFWQFSVMCIFTFCTWSFEVKKYLFHSKCLFNIRVG